VLEGRRSPQGRSAQTAIYGLAAIAVMTIPAIIVWRSVRGAPLESPQPAPHAPAQAIRAPATGASDATSALPVSGDVHSGTPAPAVAPMAMPEAGAERSRLVGASPVQRARIASAATDKLRTDASSPPSVTVLADASWLASAVGEGGPSRIASEVDTDSQAPIPAPSADVDRLFDTQK
jgi:hypothetical protein